MSRTARPWTGYVPPELRTAPLSRRRGGLLPPMQPLRVPLGWRIACCVWALVTLALYLVLIVALLVGAIWLWGHA